MKGEVQEGGKGEGGGGLTVSLSEVRRGQEGLALWEDRSHSRQLDTKR